MAFNLTESFRQQYKVYLEERQSKEDYSKALEEFESAQRNADAGFDVINEYFQYYSDKQLLKEQVLNEDPPTGGRPGASAPDGSEKDKKEKKEDKLRKLEDRGSDINNKVAQTINTVFDMVRNISDETKDARARIDDYEPVVGHVKVEKISEMKFPENVIFFFQQLISWVVNVIKKFISFFTTAIQRFFNIPQAKEYDADINLNLQRAKKIESLAMPLSYSKEYGTKGNMPKAVTLLGFEPSAYEKVRSLFSLSEASKINEVEGDVDTNKFSRDASIGGGFKAEPRESKQVIAIDINISKEMEGIQQLLQHFLDLFDNAYGSNREKLFGTEDLEMLLELFRKTIAELTKGTVSTTAIAGKLTSMELLDSGKLKDNMVRTKVNTDNLKRVYIQIEQSISNMLAILSHKQLVALENLGSGYRFYSASTYIQMIKILDAIKPRIKQSEEMERDLKKMKEVFDKIVIQLGKQRQALVGYGEITYTSVYQRRINDLFEGARFVSQTISLRLATLGLFIRQIKDVRESIYTVNSMNERSKEFLKKQAFSF
jgi:hypothetical protein